MNKEKIHFEFFKGMISRQALSKMPVSFSPLILNCDLDEAGSVVGRKGQSLIGTTQSGNGIQGLVHYEKNNGEKCVKVIRNNSLDILNLTTLSLSTYKGNAFTGDAYISSIQFLDAIYYTSENNYLQYESATSGTGVLTVVNSGDSRIKGQTLAVTPTTMFIGCLSGQEDRVYYTRAVSGLPNANTFWNEGETSLLDSTRYFSTRAKNTALQYFSVTGKMYAFNDSEGYEFDVSLASNPNVAITKRFNNGCVNARAITECNGWLIWVDEDFNIWGWNGVGNEKLLSYPLGETGLDESMIGAITRSNSAKQNINIWAEKNKFYVYIGTVSSYIGNTINNVVVKGNFTQSSNTLYLSLESYPYTIRKPVLTTIQNKKTLVYASGDSNDLYRSGVGLNDSNKGVPVAISNIYYTPFYDFQKPFSDKEIEQVIIGFYTSNSTATECIDVAYAINSTIDYDYVSKLNSGIFNKGVVNQYDSNILVKENIRRVSFPTFNFRNISLKLENLNISQSFSLLTLTFEVIYRDIIDVNYKAT